jgi:hypothetical protein
VREDREARAARNEMLFREVNENIARVQGDFHAPVADPMFVCECADLECAEKLPTVDLGVFRRTRENARRFLVIPGHEDPQIESVVETYAVFLVVEKLGEAGEVVEAAGPEHDSKRA